MKQTLLLRSILLLFFFSIASFVAPVVAQTCTVSVSASSTLLCQGQQVQLTGNASFAAESWEWYLQGQATPVATTQNYQASVAGRYTLKASGSNCGTIESSSIEITAGSVPGIVSFSSGSSKVCSGALVTYSVGAIASAQSYTWLLPSGWAIQSGQGTNSVTVTAGSSGTISVKAVNACGEGPVTSMAVNVVGTPGLPDVTNAYICAGSSATLSVQNPTPTFIYSWYATATGGTRIATGASLVTGTLTSTQKYYVQAENECGFVSARSEVTVNVSAPIGNNLIEEKQALCAGQIPESITGSVPTGGNGIYSYTWEVSYDGVNFMVASGQYNGISYSPGAVTQPIWLRRKVLSGSCAYTYSNAIYLSILPAPAAPLAGNATACEGGITKLNVHNPDPKLTYRWYFAGQPNGIFAVGPSILSAPVMQDTLYYVEAVNEAGCVGPRTSVVVTLVEPFYDNTIGEAHTICAGDIAVQLGGLAPKGGNMNYSYLWEASIDGVSYTAATGLNTTKYYSPDRLEQTTWFRRKIVSESCPLLVSEPVKITVLPKPEKPSINLGATTLTASIAGVTYTWLKDGVELSNVTTRSISFDAAGSYKVRVQNEQGCYSDFSEALQATPQPNALNSELANMGVSVAPNPTSGKIVVHTRQPLENAVAAVYNLAGKEVYRQAIGAVAVAYELNLAHLESGVYVLFVRTGKQQFVQRIIIVK
ncbi:Ig-like domain-containing protein [Pontibacter cellulosilyticus]|uniref:T9SS type A sorting domain-containing protein n=1 Tax=Pontibacter cellulosilyticus TaxID=1720253 RepID=A0A923SJS5_9BACT|nr:T9SS type A sorting domain-containing protein [Pontibacter cellulosilyticus]MBC5993982.1 T9SS type A sorting domain-containing protein [Pontibacter cellulosilyticus]